MHIVRQDWPKWFDVIRHLRISCMHWGLPLLQSGRKIWSSLARATPLQSVCLHGQPTALDIKCFLLCNSVTYLARPLDPGMALWTQYASVYTYIKESHYLSAIQRCQSATLMSVVKVLLHRVFLMWHICLPRKKNICLHPYILKLVTHGGISRPV